MSGVRGSTLAVVQARTSSARLQGKVLLPIEGTPMILRQLERVGRARLVDGIVVATSVDPSDDELSEILVDAGYDVVRGPLDDVLDRFIDVLDDYDAEVIVRLTGDCPLACPSVIDEVVQAFQSSEADYLSNTMVPSYPDGLDVEVMTREALTAIAAMSTDPAEREHVTLGIYRRPNSFVIENYVDPTGRDNSQLRWTVDNVDDLDFVATVYAALGNQVFDYADILEFLQQNPEAKRTNEDSPRNAALDGLDTGVMQHRGSAS